MNAVTAAIRAVLHDSRETDPAKLAVEVDTRLTDEDRAKAWRKMLTDAVHLEISRTRPRSAPPRVEPTPAPPAAKKAAAGSHASPRLAQAASWWTTQLRSRYAVNGGWKFLADMSREDVLQVAFERRALARATERQAAVFEALAKAMKTAGAATVADLSEDVATAVFKDAA